MQSHSLHHPASPSISHRTQTSTSRHARQLKCYTAVTNVQLPAMRQLAPGWVHMSRPGWLTATGPQSLQGRARLKAPSAVSFEGAIPEGVQVEVKGPEAGEDVEWDAETKTLKLPINVVEGSGERRTKLVIFTCNKCGGRTARNVNPIAWENGMVMGQCATCQVWHVLSAKNPKIFEEIRYNQPGSAPADSTASSQTTVQQADEEADSASSHQKH